MLVVILRIIVPGVKTTNPIGCVHGQGGIIAFATSSKKIQVSKTHHQTHHMRTQHTKGVSTIATMIRSLPTIILGFLLLVLPATAQFNGFFEQMFGQDGGQRGHPQQQQQQDVPSDSKWYRSNYEAGIFFPLSSSSSLGGFNYKDWTC
jgi:hypothetical protein